jgi:methyl-accepting chemotaxis protein
VVEATRGIEEITDATDEQAASAEEVSSLVDETAGRSREITRETVAITAAIQQQTVMVLEANETLSDMDE